jgi:hypothetical protein
VTPAVRAAVIAGTAVRVLRPLGRILPGLAGAALASIGVGEVAGHLFRHDLTWWVACVVAAAFLIRIGAEINAGPPAPRQEDPDG